MSSPSAGRPSRAPHRFARFPGEAPAGRRPAARWRTYPAAPRRPRPAPHTAPAAAPAARVRRQPVGAMLRPSHHRLAPRRPRQRLRRPVGGGQVARRAAPATPRPWPGSPCAGRPPRRQAPHTAGRLRAPLGVPGRPALPVEAPAPRRASPGSARPSAGPPPTRGPCRRAPPAPVPVHCPARETEAHLPPAAGSLRSLAPASWPAVASGSAVSAAWPRRSVVPGRHRGPGGRRQNGRNRSSVRFMVRRRL